MCLCSAAVNNMLPNETYTSVQKCPGAAWSHVRKIPLWGSDIAETSLWKEEVEAFWRYASNKKFQLTSGSHSGQTALSQQVVQGHLQQEQNTGISVLTKDLQVSGWGTNTRPWVKAKCWGYGTALTSSQYSDMEAVKTGPTLNTGSLSRFMGETFSFLGKSVCPTQRFAIH